MRLLRINNTDVDIDDTTAIGITLQTYDIKEPGKKKISISNTFTIPLTAKNARTIGFADDVQSLNTTIYAPMYCDYWLDNEHVITNAKVRIQEVQERISLFVFQKPDIWDLIKEYTWPTFLPEFLAWLQSEKDYPSQDAPNLGSFSTFLSDYIDSSEGIFLPLFFGNLYNDTFNKIGETKTFDFIGGESSKVITADFDYTLTNWDSGGSSNVSAVFINGVAATYPFIIRRGATVTFWINKPTGAEPATLSFFGEDIYLEDSADIYLKYYPTYETEQRNGGHFCIFVKTIFEFLQEKYGVNFCVKQTGILGNIWADPYAASIYIPARDIDVMPSFSSGGVVNGFYFDIVNGGTFAPETPVDKQDKTVYDFVNSFFQHFNIVKDDIWLGAEPAVRLARFDDMKTVAEIADWSDRISGTPKFKPYVDGYNQKNYIKFSSVYPDGPETANCRIITCQNKNLDVTQDLFTIDAHIPEMAGFQNTIIPDLSTDESFSTFVFLTSILGDLRSVHVNLSHDTANQQATVNLKLAAIYSLASEYTFLNEIMAYPRFYEIEKYLSMDEVRNMEFFKQYWIQQLNGSFFINKISGFNPDKSNSPTKIELIKIGTKCVLKTKEVIPFVDGIQNEFQDGQDNTFV